MGGEGQNHVIITSQPTAIRYGQLKAGTGTITSHITNEYGSASIMDLSTCFGSYVNYARRGLLMTNSRSTVVIQDEISFTHIERFAWIAHTKVAKESISISTDGQTAYLRQKIEGQYVTLRCTIVTPSIGQYKFKLMDCYTYLLETTIAFSTLSVWLAPICVSQSATTFTISL